MPELYPKMQLAEGALEERQFGGEPLQTKHLEPENELLIAQDHY